MAVSKITTKEPTEGYKITAADAYDMRSRIFVAGSFLKILHLSEKAVPFSLVYFDLSSYDHVGYFDFDDLLKEWVLDETAARLTASAGAGDAGPSDYERTNKIYTNSEEFRNALRMLNECLEDGNIEALRRIREKNNKDEDPIVVGVGLHLIQKLTGNCTTNRKKSEIVCPCGCKEKVPYSNKMWIGSSETLHGELDMIAEGVVVTVAENLPKDEDVDTEDEVCETENDSFETEDEGGETAKGVEEESKKRGIVGQLKRESSNGQRVNLEFKKCVTGNTKDLYQILSQTIVFGWTEFNRHRELSPYIPSVFIDDKHFGFAVYNPVTDCLVLGKDHIPFFGPESEYPEAEYPGTEYAGIFILWLILHHRIFFRNEMDLDFECNFKQQTNVKNYEELKNYESSVRDNSVLFKFGTNFGLRIPKRKKLKTKHSKIESDQPNP